MALVSLNSVTTSFGGKPLFEEITLVIGEGERLSLIGPNGSGKSTLLSVIGGTRDIDSGQVTRRRDLVIGNVRQRDEFEPGITVEQFLLSQIPQLDSSEQQRRISQLLGMAQFADRDQLVESLSGGWRKRLAILGGLIVEPDLLLLDEPTNHLDLDGILWLEEMLERFRGALVFVSHDRYLIERVATRVVELNRRYPNGFLSVDGSYSDFLERQGNYLDELESQRESLANRVRREVEWLRQGAKARTTKSTARIKKAEELVEALGKFQTAAQRVDASFNASGRKTKELVSFERVTVGMGERTLISELTGVISPGTRLGIVGSNGTGKSTLLRLLRGELKPRSGRCVLAPNLRIAYFDQQRGQLNQELSIHRSLSPDTNFVVFNGRELHVTSWARRFLFRPEQMNTQVKNLSGGEQARLLVAKMMLEPCDLLLLDEPTNDLDIPTLEVLEDALIEFQGGLVVVSHDRFLLDRVCSSLIALRGDGRYSLLASYLQWEQQRTDWLEELTKSKSANGSEGAAFDRQASSQSSSKTSPAKLSYNEQRDLGLLPSQIESTEQRIAEIHRLLADPDVASSAEKLTPLCDELTQRQEELDRLYTRWTMLEEKRAMIAGR